MSRDPKLSLQDILESAGKVISYTKDKNQEQFEADGMAFDAVLRNLGIIGEAAKNIPDAMRSITPDVPWRMICGFRDHISSPLCCCKEATAPL